MGNTFYDLIQGAQTAEEGLSALHRALYACALNIEDSNVVKSKRVTSGFWHFSQRKNYLAHRMLAEARKAMSLVIENEEANKDEALQHFECARNLFEELMKVRKQQEVALRARRGFEPMTGVQEDSVG